MHYYVFQFTEDGDVLFKMYEKEQLETELNNKDWGENINILDADRTDLDLQHESGLIIIKGKCIKPREIKVVKQWGLE